MVGAKKFTTCPSCGANVSEWENPKVTVDIIIRIGDRIVLIERRNEPFGWALPGGFVDYGESLESAALREAKEETGLDLDNLQQFRAYSAPDRDPRQHNVSVVFSATANGVPEGGDDANRAELFATDKMPELVFDHYKIVTDFFSHPHPPEKFSL